MELCRTSTSGGFSFGDRVSVTGSPIGMCDGKSDTGTGSVFGNLCSHLPAMPPYFPITRGW